MLPLIVTLLIILIIVFIVLAIREVADCVFPDSVDVPQCGKCPMACAPNERCKV